MIRENPVRLARTGKRRVQRRQELEPFTRAEVDLLARELGPLYGPMVVFAAETGLRPGELAALEWRDVDRDDDVVSVRRVFAGGRVKEPKTERSRRRVPLSARATAALDTIPRRIDTRLVFASPSGRVIDMHNFARRDWHPALEAAGLTPRRVYDLRHSFASNALAAGISLYELSRYMGASVRVLEMHYAHLSRTPKKPRARSSTLTPQPFRRLAGVACRPGSTRAARAPADLQRNRRVGRTERCANQPVLAASPLNVG